MNFNDVIKTGKTPVLYHGTRHESAIQICAKGFKRAKSRTYTGHGVCLSESIAIAYEYGMYETGGVVMEVRLCPATRWLQSEFVPPGTKNDTLFRKHPIDAICTYGGNVWVLGNTTLPAITRILSHGEALRHMTTEFDAEGPDVCYNGVVDDFASIWWGCTNLAPAFQRFPDYQRQLTQTLLHHVGRSSSTKQMADV